MRLPGLGRLRRALRRVRNRPAGVILLYHRIAGADEDPWGLAVSPGHFAEQMDVLRRSARAVPLARMTEAPRGGAAKRRAAVTFDDGYADTFLVARPLLERHDVPATVFLATGYVGRNREFWWDELAGLLLHPGPLPALLRLAVAGTACEWILRDGVRYGEDAWRRFRAWRAPDAPPTDRHRLYYSLWQRLRVQSDAEQQRVLDDLAAWAGLERTTRPPYRPLAADEAVALGRGRLIEIGAHTHTHPLLAALPAAAQRAEVRASLERCRALAAGPVTSFAYPFGNYAAETVAIIREAGFTLACSTAGGAVRQSDHPLELPRVHVQDWDGEEFERRLAGWLAG